MAQINLRYYLLASKEGTVALPYYIILYFTICFAWSRYHIPRSWFHPSGNILVVFEEKGGDPTRITFSRRAVTSVCSFVSEHFPSIDLESWDESATNEGTSPAKAQLSCPEGKNISSVKFASLGTPSGTCRSYQKGSCHHPNSLSVVEKVKFEQNSRFLTQMLTWSRFQYQITNGPDISSDFLRFVDACGVGSMHMNLVLEFVLCSVVATGFKVWFTVRYHQVFLLGPFGMGFFFFLGGGVRRLWWGLKIYKGNSIFKVNMSCLIIVYQLWLHWDPHTTVDHIPYQAS